MKMKKIINFIAYVAIIFVALALVIGSFWSKASVLRDIAEVLAYGITGISAFYFARSRQNKWFMVAFILASVIVVVTLVLGYSIAK